MGVGTLRLHKYILCRNSGKGPREDLSPSKRALYAASLVTDPGIPILPHQAWTHSLAQGRQGLNKDHRCLGPASPGSPSVDAETV